MIPGVNTTADVRPGEIARQGAKFGFDLDANGLPPLISGSLKTRQKREAQNTTNKDKTGGQTFYGKDGTPPNRRAPMVESDQPEWKVWFHREPKQKDAYAGDCYTVRAPTESAAKKECSKLLDQRWPKRLGHTWKVVARIAKGLSGARRSRTDDISACKADALPTELWPREGDSI